MLWSSSGRRKGWFSNTSYTANTSFTTGLKTLPTFRPDALVFFRAKIFTLKKTRASGRNVGKVFNPVVKLVLENQPFLMFGHHFELVTDHQPLLALMSEYRSRSPQASARVRRWALFLSMNEYTLQFRKTEAHCNADALSRLPLPTAPKEVPVPPELVLLMQHLQQLPVTADHIRLWTRRDPVLAKVFQFVQHGWPYRVDPELAPFA